MFYQMVIDKITWPAQDSDDEEFDVESMCRITGFLRIFIETGIGTFFFLFFLNKAIAHIANA